MKEPVLEANAPRKIAMFFPEWMATDRKAATLPSAMSQSPHVIVSAGSSAFSESAYFKQISLDVVWIDNSFRPHPSNAARPY
jgi:hypothetical protein